MCNIREIEIREADLPLLDDGIFLQSYNNTYNQLTNIEQPVELYKIFTNFPYYLDIDYRIVIKRSDNVVLDNIEEDIYELENHVLTIKPAFRDIQYNLEITAFDRFESVNSNVITISVEEKSAGIPMPSRIELNTLETCNLVLNSFYVLPEFTFEVYSEPDRNSANSVRSPYYVSGNVWDISVGDNDESNLLLTPEFRNDEYNLIVKVFDRNGVLVIGGSNVIRIAEGGIDDIETLSVIDVDGLRTTAKTCNIEDQIDFSYYPFEGKLQYTINNGVDDEKYNQNFNSNVEFLPDLRGITYDMYVSARDDNYGLEECNLLYRITERYPVDKSVDIDDIEITGYQYVLDRWDVKEEVYQDLSNNYIINHENELCNLYYDVYSNSELVISKNDIIEGGDTSIYYGCNQFKIENNSLYIYGDYRGVSYDVGVYAYIEGYSNQHFKDHVFTVANVFESNVPQIELKDSVIECNIYIYNQVLTDIDYDNSLLYSNVEYPFWDHVEYEMVLGMLDSDGADRRLTLDSNTGILNVKTELETSSTKQYSINIIISDGDNRFKNHSKNNEIVYNIHELGKIDYIESFNTDLIGLDYGSVVCNLLNAYNVYQTGYILNDVGYDDIIEFRHEYVGDMGSKEVISVGYDSSVPEFEIPIDVRGISYDVQIDVSYKNKYDNTSNRELKFHVDERDPIEYSTEFQHVYYIAESNVGIDSSNVKERIDVSEGVRDITIDLNTLFNGYNPNCNVNMRYSVLIH